MLYCLQYDVTDCLARMLAKMPVWTRQSGSEDIIGVPFDNRADFIAERSALFQSASLYTAFS